MLAYEVQLPRGITMKTVDILVVQPLIALIFGILILIFPRLLNYLVAIYLIFIGLIGLWPHVFGTALTH